MKGKLSLWVLWCVVLGMCATQASAQKLKVASFVQDATDLTARKDMPRQDRNGDYDGLVKIQMVQKGVTFETNMVDTVVERTSEYWVFMYKGAKKLMVKHSDYLPLTIDFRDYGFRGGVAERAYLTFKTYPASCQISVSSTTVSESRQTDEHGEVRNWHLPYGTYRCHIAAAGFRDKDTTVVLSREPVTVDVRLMHATGTLSIVRPSNASVTIHPKGDALQPSTSAATTGEVISNLKGRYEVTVTKKGFVPKTRTIDVAPQKDYRETFSLMPTVDQYNFVNYVGTPHAPIGLMFGNVKRWGWYVAAKTAPRTWDIVTSEKDGVDEYGVSVDQGSMHYKYEHVKHIDGQADYSDFSDKGVNEWSLTAGAVRRIAPWGFLFAGGGYGVGEHLYLDETANELYTDQERNGRGVVAELGLMFKLRGITLLGGYQLRFAKGGVKGEPVFGLGFTINLTQLNKK